MYFLKKIIRKILSKTFYKNNIKEEKFLENYFLNKQKKFIVQIGGNDGVQNDPLRKYFEKSGNYKAIIFEPINFYYQKLKKLYFDRNDILVQKKFIFNYNEIKKIFFINPEICDEMDGDGPKNRWAHGQGSFDRKIIEFFIEKNSFRGSNYINNIERYKKNIISEDVSSLSLKEVNFSKNTLNLILIDVQGFELEVISSINFNEKIDYIYYEDEFPFSKKSKSIKEILKINNFKILGKLNYKNQIYQRIS